MSPILPILREQYVWSNFLLRKLICLKIGLKPLKYLEKVELQKGIKLVATAAFPNIFLATSFNHYMEIIFHLCLSLKVLNKSHDSLTKSYD